MKSDASRNVGKWRIQIYKEILPQDFLVYSMTVEHVVRVGLLRVEFRNFADVNVFLSVSYFRVTRFTRNIFDIKIKWLIAIR